MQFGLKKNKQKLKHFRRSTVKFAERYYGNYDFVEVDGGSLIVKFLSK